MIIKRYDDNASFEIFSESNSNRVTLKYDKKNPYWTKEVRNTVAGTIVDMDDCVSISLEGVHLLLTYSQAEILFLLLKEGCGLKTSHYEKWKRVK